VGAPGGTSGNFQGRVSTISLQGCGTSEGVIKVKDNGKTKCECKSKGRVFPVSFHEKHRKRITGTIVLIYN
jgi:hypothetical protein